MATEIKNETEIKDPAKKSEEEREKIEVSELDEKALDEVPAAGNGVCGLGCSSK